MRLSILHLIFAGVLTACFIFFMFTKWQDKNVQIKALNNEILIAQAEINNIEEQGNNVLTYVRISKSLDLMAGKELSERQKNILAEKLFAISIDYKIDPILILAIIRHESKGNPNAKGAYASGEKSGALGLMQIKYETAMEIAHSVGVKIDSPEDLFIPEKNLMVGTAYLLRLIAKYKNLQHALIAYNVGLGTLDEKLRSGSALPLKYYNKIIWEYQFLTERIFDNRKRAISN
jgi:soluble lytic murein transglycosylase